MFLRNKVIVALKSSFGQDEVSCRSDRDEFLGGRWQPQDRCYHCWIVLSLPNFIARFPFWYRRHWALQRWVNVRPHRQLNWASKCSAIQFTTRWNRIRSLIQLAQHRLQLRNGLSCLLLDAGYFNLVNEVVFLLVNQWENFLVLLPVA